MSRRRRFAAKFPFVRRAGPVVPSDREGLNAALPDVSGEGIFFDGTSAKTIPVSVRIAGGRLILDGPVQREWDCRELRASETVRPFMRLGPAQDSERLELTDAALGAAIEAASPNLRAHDRTPYRLIGGSVAATAALLMFALYGLPILVNFVVPAIPLSFERRVAEVAWKQLTTTPPFTSQECTIPAGKAALDQMVASLKIAAWDPALHLSPVEIDARVIETPVANAFALPGGNIVVTSRLIARARSADELAGVIAHELGHVAARDPTRLMLQNLGRSLLLGFFMGDVTGSTVLVALGNEVVTARYDREAERAADAFAARTMKRAGADAAAIAGFLERIDPYEAGPPAFLRSHPYTRDRAAAIRAQAAGARETHSILDDEAWAALKKICPLGGGPRFRVGPPIKR